MGGGVVPMPTPEGGTYPLLSFGARSSMGGSLGLQRNDPAESKGVLRVSARTPIHTPKPDEEGGLPPTTPRPPRPPAPRRRVLMGVAKPSRALAHPFPSLSASPLEAPEAPQPARASRGGHGEPRAGEPPRNRPLSKPNPGPLAPLLGKEDGGPG